MSNFYVYIITNKRNGTLYTGMTNYLERRILEHKEKSANGFSSRYGLNQLVYFEEHEDFDTAFTRERQIKKWKRDWKLKLIESKNPKWNDLSSDWHNDTISDEK